MDKQLEEFILKLKQDALDNIGPAPDQESYEEMLKWLKDIEEHMAEAPEEERDYFYAIRDALISSLVPEKNLN